MFRTIRVMQEGLLIDEQTMSVNEQDYLEGISGIHVKESEYLMLAAPGDYIQVFDPDTGNVDWEYPVI